MSVRGSQRRGLALLAGVVAFALLTALGWAVLFWIGLATGFMSIACGHAPDWTNEYPGLAKLLVLSAAASAPIAAFWASLVVYGRLTRSIDPPGA